MEPNIVQIVRKPARYFPSVSMFLHHVIANSLEIVWLNWGMIGMKFGRTVAYYLSWRVPRPK